MGNADMYSVDTGISGLASSIPTWTHQAMHNMELGSDDNIMLRGET